MPIRGVPARDAGQRHDPAPDVCGCKVEYLGNRTGQRIERAVTIKPVIAWRLAAMTLLGHETPELPMEVFFTQVQIRVLLHFAAVRDLAAPGNLRLAVRTMAILGGYLYRKIVPAGPSPESTGASLAALPP